MVYLNRCDLTICLSLMCSANTLGWTFPSALLRRPSSSTFKLALPAFQAISGDIYVSSCIDKDEASILHALIESTGSDVLRSSVTCQRHTVELDPKKLPPGVTARVVMTDIQINESLFDDDVIQHLSSEIADATDELHYNLEMLSQPILLSVDRGNTSDIVNSVQERMTTLILKHIDDYSLREPLVSREPTVHSKPETTPVPSFVYQVDGAHVLDPSLGQETWDTSSVLVYDDVLDDSLRSRLLEIVLNRANGDDTWDDANGPDPKRWIQGGLVDQPSNDSDEGSSYGLSVEAIYELCHRPPPKAIAEFEDILVSIFPDMIVARLPEAVLGASVSPLTANAPCAGQSFRFHIDGDPFFAPPSPWTDIFGRYANRATAKPRFVSCIVYINDEWKCDEWGAPTRCMDVPSGQTIDIRAIPGRFVIMDQDVTHSVIAPNHAAGKRPRYSLVWKLILHPRHSDQDMRHWKDGRWPRPTPV